MADDELIRALEKEAATLTDRGRTLEATGARRLASTLRHAIKAHNTALDEVVRAEKRTKAGGDGLADARAVLQIRWAMVLESQDRARQFLEAPR